MTRSALWSAAAALLAAAPRLAAADPSQGQPYPPGTYQLTPYIDLHPEAVPVEVPARFAASFRQGTALRLPPGFTAKVFAAQGLGNPRELVLGPDGVLYAADASGGGTRDSKGSRVLALPDGDGDGVADEVKVVADSLSMCYSIGFYQGELYAAETHQVVKLIDEDGDGFRERHLVIVPDIPDVPPGAFHTSRNMAIDERQGRLYVQVGSPCDLCRQEEPVIGYTAERLPLNPEFGTILVADMDGSGRRVWATGIRNVVGMDIHPVTGELWATHNHYDLQGSEIPPEWIDIVRDGDFMGYPLVYGWQAWVDFALEPYRKILPITRADSLRVATHKRPVALVNAHLAPMAIHFYRGDLFPPQYRHVAFVAIRGGKTPGNLASVPGFKVVALFSQPDGSQAQLADFLTGFYEGDQPWGKPVGLAEDRQGNLYVASNEGVEAIYRIGYSPIVAEWEHDLPDTLRGGDAVDLEGRVVLHRLGEGAGEPQLTLDLSALGGPPSMPLERAQDGTYPFRTRFVVDVANGVKQVQVRIVQGPYANRLVDDAVVLPSADAVALGDGPAPGWTVEHSTFAKVQPRQTEVVFAGAAATAIEGTSSGIAGWRAEFVTHQPVEPAGFHALRFAIHPGRARFDGRSLSVGINNPSRQADTGLGYGQYQLPSQPVDLLLPGPDGRAWFDPEQKAWQVVEIPLAVLRVAEPVERIRFFGNANGTFYLDEVRLVVAAGTPLTAVVGQEPRPQGFALGDNYPNPFNGQTVIPFQLGADGVPELAIYDLAGQRVATLLLGRLPPGSHQVTWGGRDDEGRPVASGVYVCGLRSGSQRAFRKLVLAR